MKFYAVSSAVDTSGVTNSTGTATGAELNAGLGAGSGLVSGLGAGTEETLSVLSPDMAFFQEGVVLLRALFDPTDAQWQGLDRYDEKGLLSCRNYLPSFEQVMTPLGSNVIYIPGLTSRFSNR